MIPLNKHTLHPQDGTIWQRDDAKELVVMTVQEPPPMPMGMYGWRRYMFGTIDMTLAAVKLPEFYMTVMAQVNGTPPGTYQNISAQNLIQMLNAMSARWNRNFAVVAMFDGGVGGSVLSLHDTDMEAKEEFNRLCEQAEQGVLEMRDLYTGYYLFEPTRIGGALFVTKEPGGLPDNQREGNPKVN